MSSIKTHPPITDSTFFWFNVFTLILAAAATCALIAAFFSIPDESSVVGFCTLAFFSGVLALGSIAAKKSHKHLMQLAAKDFEWYKSSYPKNLSGGRVSCYNCGGSRIHVRALMQKTYMREHFCTQCGTPLYYSPETKIP